MPIRNKNLKIRGCQRWCSEFWGVPGTRGTRANSSPAFGEFSTIFSELFQLIGKWTFLMKGCEISYCMLRYIKSSNHWWLEFWLHKQILVHLVINTCLNKYLLCHFACSIMKTRICKCIWQTLKIFFIGQFSICN